RADPVGRDRERGGDQGGGAALVARPGDGPGGAAAALPVFGLVCDLEAARGFAELRKGFPPDTLKQRLGQKLPLVPDLPTAEVPGLLERGAQWIGQAVLPVWILKFLRLEPSDPRKTPPAVGGHNRNLYLL